MHTSIIRKYEITCTSDIDECVLGMNQCADDATCFDTVGSYECVCDPGFTGDGFNCTSTV